VDWTEPCLIAGRRQLHILHIQPIHYLEYQGSLIDILYTKPQSRRWDGLTSSLVDLYTVNKVRWVSNTKILIRISFMLTEKNKFIIEIAWGFGLFVIGIICLECAKSTVLNIFQHSQIWCLVQCKGTASGDLMLFFLESITSNIFLSFVQFSCEKGHLTRVRLYQWV
jgi:hypothetical protein